MGQPLCRECFDYDALAIWNATVPELWRRTMIYLQRELARAAVRTAWKLGGLRALADLKLRRWAHRLGYRGHWSTKSRHYSTTLGALRDERRRFAKHRNGEPEHEQVVSLGDWRYGGIGHQTAADAWLADSAVSRRRTERRIGREGHDEDGIGVSSTKIEPLLLRVDEAAEALALSRTPSSTNSWHPTSSSP